MNGDWTLDGHTVEFTISPYGGVDLDWLCPWAGRTFDKNGSIDNVPACHLATDEDSWYEHQENPDEIPAPKPEIVNFCNVGEYLMNDSLEECVPRQQRLATPKVNPFPVEYLWTGEGFVWRPAETHA